MKNPALISHQFPATAMVFGFITMLLASGLCLGAEPAKVKTNDFTSSKVCGSCHENIFNTWRNSLHADSLNDPIFRASYMEAYYETGGRASEVCTACHAPFVNINKDYGLKKEITREGVACDFCHSLKDVSLSASGLNRFVVEPGLVKRGSIAKTSSPAHQVAYSKLHEGSLICAGCHEHTNAWGAPILTTYSEWQATSYAREGKPCQTCHMQIQEGGTVTSQVSESAQRKFNVHSIAGGHSPEQLKKSVDVDIADLKRSGDKVFVKVLVTNSGAGHMIPTGMPTRRLLLKFIAKKQDNIVYETERVYEKVLADKDNRTLSKDWEIILNSKKVVKDTRLGAKETREEFFNFRTTDDDPLVINAALFYDYSPQIMDRANMHMELKSVNRVVPGL